MADKDDLGNVEGSKILKNEDNRAERRVERTGTVHLMEQKMFGGAPENKDAGGKSLNSMTKAELVSTAEAEGVDIETDDNRADLIEKIEKARG
ncbi:MAG TPA: hypothetical protein VM531_07315 [Sphingomicrobium sp.]|nr:hypothetical protein [Sphingomicrobium sp.]